MYCFMCMKAEYFGGNYPHLEFLDQKLEIELKENTHYKIFSENSREGFEIELSKIPKGVTKIRFYNSY